MIIQILSALAAASSLMAILLFLRVTVWKSDAPAPRLPDYEDPEAAGLSAEAMGRIFSTRDRYFLRLQPGFDPALERRMNVHRRRAMSLFLKQHYGEFRRLMATASEVARAADAAFGADLAKLSVRFHLLYAFACVQSQLAGRGFAPATPEKVAAMVRRLRTDISVRQATLVAVHGQ